MSTCAQHEADLQAALERVKELETTNARQVAWLDGKEHRHESGKVCVACVPTDEAEADRIERENTRLERLRAKVDDNRNIGNALRALSKWADFQDDKLSRLATEALSDWLDMVALAGPSSDNTTLSHPGVPR